MRHEDRRSTPRKSGVHPVRRGVRPAIVMALVTSLRLKSQAAFTADLDAFETLLKGRGAGGVGRS